MAGRYQSPAGLVYDLERSLEDLEAHGSIRPFPLGERDVPETLQISQKLYGRDRPASFRISRG